jgi:hypothetical protein
MGIERVDSRERNPQNPRNPTKDQEMEMGKHPNPKPQTTRIQDPTKLLASRRRGEREAEKPRSPDGNFACNSLVVECQVLKE